MKKDLVVLVADLDMEQTLEGLLARHHALGIRPISFDIRRHPNRDPGCLNEAHTLLRSQHTLYTYALVLFDYHGCGQEAQPIETLEQQVQKTLAQNGWEGRAAVVILNPELENWVWSDSPEVDKILGWGNRKPDLRTWLRDQQLLSPETTKPSDPKRAMEAAIREVRKSRSASIFRQLADQVSVKRCTDAAFLRFSTVLKEWFATA